MLVFAAAGPYTLAEAEVTGDPQVTMLVDRSSSMGPVENVTDDLTTAVEAEDVAVSTRVVGSGTRSPIGDGIANALSANGSVIVVSDGHVTRGRSLGAAAGLAQQVNTTINAVSLSTTRTERAVTIQGPAKTSTGVSNDFFVGVRGTQLDGSSTQVTVSVDGTQVASRSVSGAGGFELSRNFTSTGDHRITARIDSEDAYDVNDVFRKTVRVVEPPEILYVSRGQYPFEGFLSRLYSVERAERVPGNLSEYYAVVVQDVAADDIGNVSELRQSVINGTGLVTVGGPNSFEYGSYRNSQFIELLPVSIGQGGKTSRIVLAIDISGSTSGSLSVQQALALNAIEQLGDRNRVGVVAFNRQAYAVSTLRRLGESRADIARNIRRLQSKGATDISAGIDGARQLLGNSDGTIILLSDGRDFTSDARSAARTAAKQNIRTIPIGVGKNVSSRRLRTIARAGDGTYLSADETNKLRIFFGGDTRQYRGGGLTVVDTDHFITSGVELTATPGRANAVAAEDRADFLVAGPSGSPAITAWRYGLGRSVAITAYGSDGTLDGLLSSPDSLALTKAVNWAIGDPERLETDVVDVPDARAGNPVDITYEGRNRPSVTDLQFSLVGDRTYRATTVPESPGYCSVLSTEYAVNYPIEYERFGSSATLRNAVSRTGGKVYEPDQAATIASAVRQQTTRIETVRTEWQWLAIILALLAYLVEAGVRRYYRIKA